MERINKIIWLLSIYFSLRNDNSCVDRLTKYGASAFEW
jgi:hypothetical protein